MKKKRKPKIEPFPLKQLLKAKQISQIKAAAACGITLPTISRIANGHKSPSWSTIWRLFTSIEGIDLGDLDPRKYDKAS